MEISTSCLKRDGMGSLIITSLLIFLQSLTVKNYENRLKLDKSYCHELNAFFLDGVFLICNVFEAFIFQVSWTCPCGPVCKTLGRHVQ